MLTLLTPERSSRPPDPTVGVAVLVHGLSAAPLVSRYAAWYTAAADKHPPAMESKPMHEHRTRGPGKLPSS